MLSALRVELNLPEDIGPIGQRPLILATRMETAANGSQALERSGTIGVDLKKPGSNGLRHEPGLADTRRKNVSPL